MESLGSLMAAFLYLDCFSGASGDMFLGALVELGVPVEGLRQVVAGLGVDPAAITVARVARAGVAATKVRVVEPDEATHEAHHEGPQPHDHDHHHHHHHRTLGEIAACIDRSGLSPEGRERAKALFRRLADVEAGIHQIPVEQVHLHEVGALDSIVDIVGTVWAMEWLGVTEVMASPLNLGSGTVACAHGTFPVPAPATAALLRGRPVYSSGAPGELVTPTGALLVTEFASSFGPLPPMRIDRIGYGAGDRDVPGVPNVLRAFLGERLGARAEERVVVVEFEVDDMNPQIFGSLMDRLYAAGALEVFYAPVQMKKNRPGTLVTIVVPPEARDAVTAVVFAETTTIGVRYHEVGRECLARDVCEVETPVGPIRFKVARRDGVVVNAAPEFDDCLRAAAERSLPVKTVQAIAVKAYLERTGGK